MKTMGKNSGRFPLPVLALVAAGICGLAFAPGTASAAKAPAKKAAKKAARPQPPPGMNPQMNGMRDIFGQVSAVRGNVIQMRSPESKGLTRVIITPKAMVQSQETVKLDTLKPGVKIEGEGRGIEGPADRPTKVEVQSVEVMGGGGGPGGFFFGGGNGPLWRGRDSGVFRRQNYSGTITFEGQVKSVNPLVLVDNKGNALPVTIAPDATARQRVMRPVKEGDINAGSMIVAIGKPTPDGLINADMIILIQGANGPQSMNGKISGMTAKGLKIHPRFMPQDMEIELAPTAKLYSQETLDMDGINEGDMLQISGNVLEGDAKNPALIVAQTMAPGNETLPQLDAGGDSPFRGGRQVKAQVKGKVLGFDPLRLQTDDGREVSVIVPGQVPYVHFLPIQRSALKMDDMVLMLARFKKGGGLVADTVVANASPVLGPGF